jgi:hypothetical protein
MDRWAHVLAVQLVMSGQLTIFLKSTFIVSSIPSVVLASK